MPFPPPLPHDPRRQIYQLRPRNDPNDSWATSTTPLSSAEVPSTLISSSTPATPDIPQTTDVSLTQISIPESTPTPTILSSQSGAGTVVFTSIYPFTTITQPSTTITSFTELLVTQEDSSSSLLSSTFPQSSFTSSTTASAALSTNSLIESRSVPICIGQGLDSAAAGILSVVIVPTIIGVILWILFAVLRPRFRQVYALREWFVQPDLRPKPLGSAFFAFLFPKVPLVPSIPSDVSDAGRSAANDARLFPSDEELTQRALWIALLIGLGWSVLALGGALPLYLVDTPCNADYAAPVLGGGYSTLTDLSFLRLLRAVETGGITTSDFSDGLQRRSDPIPESLRLRVRVIILAALVIVLGVFPALWKIIREFNHVAAYRSRWLQTKCEGKDLAWLSAKDAPGYANWGERQFKDHLVKIGLSSTLTSAGRQNGNGNGHSGGARPRDGTRTTRRREEEQPLNDKHEETVAEVDIQSLFSIGDTHKIAMLIQERDQILENLEISETKYINSFRVTTPDPSVLDFVPPPPPDPSRPYISRPIPLAGQQRKSRPRRHVNRAFASSSLAPTSFIAPSSYYKLRGVQGVSGGRFAEAGADRHQSFADSINSRVIGSRFMEVNRNSVAYGRLPLGTNVAVEQSGELGPVDRGSWLPPIPDPRLFGPNYGLTAYEDMEVDEHGVVRTIYEQEEAREWVDLSQEEEQFATDYNGIPPEQAGPSSFLRRPRPPKTDTTPPSTRRETFPRRETTYNTDSDTVPPPHLRLQPAQPFVRPLDGLGFEDLGHVYAEITQWRSRLKIINVDIAEAQNQSYTDIAHGTKINGWLMVGRGLRFIPGAQIIEGRAKEDIRWDVLQNERSGLDTAVMWAVIIATVVILGAALTAAVGLYLAPAPGFAHYIPFLQPLSNGEIVASGIATILAPAFAATIFVILGVRTVHWVASIHGSVSVSGNQLLIFKITFFLLTGVGGVWLVAIGAVLFSMQAFNTGTDPTLSLSNGAVYMSILALALIINVAIILPGCLLLQPLRLWRVIRAEKAAITPRQRFRAVYPMTYDPTLAIGACVLALVFASTFALVFPLIAPAVVILLFLTLLAHRFLVGYVYARTHSQTGGLLYLWLLRRFGTLLCLQPLLVGLICLALHFWEEGGVLIGTAIFIILFMEGYTSWKMRLPGRNSLSPITVNSLDTFSTGADTYHDDINSVNDSTPAGTRTRGSMASVLEMMSVTLAVMPSSSNHRGAVPLPTETLDDLTATERAARTHPDAPPRLPPLPFTDHAEDMAGILYAPELIAPPPIIWLPKDSANLAQSEAVDLQKYHDLQVTVDVRSKEDVLHLQRTSSSSRRPSR